LIHANVQLWTALSLERAKNRAWWKGRTIKTQPKKNVNSKKYHKPEKGENNERIL
jgi:hypothetical protein